MTSDDDCLSVGDFLIPDKSIMKAFRIFNKKYQTAALSEYLMNARA